MKKVSEIKEYEAAGGETIRFPVVTIEGDEEGPHAVITAGIHGAEYPPILAALEFCSRCDPKEVAGKITIIPICSEKAFRQRSIFTCPVDGKNPNRCFPGSPDGSYTEEMVYYLFRDLISKGDYHIDMHAGDMVEALVPFAECCCGIDKDVDGKSREIAVYYGSPDVVVVPVNSNGSGEGLCYMNSAIHRIPSAIVEAGQMGQTDEASVEAHLRGIKNVLTRFGNLRGETETPGTPCFYRGWKEIVSPSQGIFYPCVRPGDRIGKGGAVGAIRNYFGEEIAEVRSPEEGKILYMISSPAVEKGDFLMDMAVDAEK